MSIYNQFTYKQIYVNNYCLLVATLARYFHSFGWLTGFYASKTRYKVLPAGELFSFTYCGSYILTENKG